MIRVTGHRLLVKEDPVETTYGESDIVIVQDENLERTTTQTGLIVDVGPDCWKAYRTVDSDGVERNGSPWARKGDYVMFARHAGRFITDPATGEEFLVMTDGDIIGIIYAGDNPIPENETRNKVLKRAK